MVPLSAARYVTDVNVFRPCRLLYPALVQWRCCGHRVIESAPYLWRHCAPLCVGVEGVLPMAGIESARTVRVELNGSHAVLEPPVVLKPTLDNQRPVLFPRGVIDEAFGNRRRC